MRARIEALAPSRYVVADLHPQTPEVREMSVTNIDFPAETFDMVICNHVLEHVPDDQRAVSEIFRVMKSGGLGVLQTPYSTLLSRSIEDPLVNSGELRKRIYGQHDHVRLYGLDLFDRLRSAGLALDVRRHEDVLTDIYGKRYGVNVHEPLVLVRKPH